MQIHLTQGGKWFTRLELILYWQAQGVKMS